MGNNTLTSIILTFFAVNFFVAFLLSFFFEKALVLLGIFCTLFMVVTIATLVFSYFKRINKSN